MILVPRAVRVYFATEPANLRRSSDGLANEIRHTLGYDLLSGHVVVFLNRRKNEVKLIVWTHGGFTIVHKRRERGTFRFPARVTAAAASVAIDAHELAMLLEGIDVSRSKERPRWEPPPRGRALCANVVETAPEVEFTVEGEQESGHHVGDCPANRPGIVPRGVRAAVTALRDRRDEPAGSRGGRQARRGAASAGVLAHRAVGRAVR